MRVVKKRCLVCDSVKVEKLWSGYSYWYCQTCNSAWFSKYRQISYSSSYYQRGRWHTLSRLVDRFSFWDRFRTINLKKDDRVVEVGYGNGNFINELVNRGYDVCGVEKSEHARNIKLLVENKKISDSIYNLPGKFDVVLMYHVLEHLKWPRKYIKRVISKMNDGGRLIVRVPNFNSLEARLAGKHWYHLDHPNHRTLFSDVGLKMMLEEVGFVDIKVRHNLGEYRQVIVYSLLSRLKVRLPAGLLGIIVLIATPILWIFLGLTVRHGVVEVEGKVDNSNNSKISSKYGGRIQSKVQ